MARPATRADLARYAGLARSTVAQRVDALLAAGLVYEAGGSASTGGRPPTVLAFNDSAGVVLAADLGATHARVAASDLSGAPFAEAAGDIDIARGPEEVLGWASERFAELLEESGHAASEVYGIGVGVPGPVEFASGRPFNPPIMPGWDGYSIPGWFRVGLRHGLSHPLPPRPYRWACCRSGQAVPQCGPGPFRNRAGSLEFSRCGVQTTEMGGRACAHGAKGTNGAWRPCASDQGRS